MKEPILFLELNSRQVLLVGALLVVEGEKQGLQIKSLEILSSIEHWYRWEHVFFFERHRMLGLLDFLILGLGDVSVRSF
jgi:hypothetical protein